MYSIVTGYRRPKALCASGGRPSAINRRGVRRTRVSGGVGGHERALRDHSFPVASQRFKNAMRQSRSVPQAGRLLWHLRVEQDDAAVFDLVVRDRERTVAQGHFKPAHRWIVSDVAFHLLPPSLTSGRTWQVRQQRRSPKRNSGCLTSDQLNSHVHGFKGSDSESLRTGNLHCCTQPADLHWLKEVLETAKVTDTIIRYPKSICSKRRRANKRKPEPRQCQSSNALPISGTSAFVREPSRFLTDERG